MKTHEQLQGVKTSLDNREIDNPQLNATTRTQSKLDRVDLILPGHQTEIQESAHHCFSVLAKTNRYFIRSLTVFELIEEEGSGVRLEEVQPDAFRSQMEKYFVLKSWIKVRDKLALIPNRCSVANASALLCSDPARKLLPPIKLVTTAAVFAEVDGAVVILDKGYHRVLGGIYVAKAHVTEDVPLERAVKELLALGKDFLFVTPSDKSRFFASMLCPALRLGGLLTADFPLLINEADESQSGKTLAHRGIATLYDETVYTIVRKEERAGVGSLEEQLAGALIAGRPLIMFENYRGDLVLSLLESAIRGTGVVPCRAPYARTVQIEPDRVCWFLSSNKAQTSTDLANRSIIIRFGKQARGYKFCHNDEVGFLKHIQHNCNYYLSCLLAVVRDWHKAKKPRTDETRHDFRGWCQSLDWIIQHILNLPPLLDGHKEEQERIANPLKNWLRDLANCVGANRVTPDQGLKPSELAEICADNALDIPGCRPTADESERAKAIGKVLKRLFNLDTELNIGSWQIRRESVSEYNPALRNTYVVHYHYFTPQTP